MLTEGLQWPIIYVCYVCTKPSMVTDAIESEFFVEFWKPWSRTSCRCYHGYKRFSRKPSFENDTPFVISIVWLTWPCTALSLLSIFADTFPIFGPFFQYLLYPGGSSTKTKNMETNGNLIQKRKLNEA